MTIAIRSYIVPYTSLGYEHISITSATIGTPDAVAAQANTNQETTRLTFLFSFTVDLALVLAGLGFLLLYRLDRASPDHSISDHSEPGYLWLGIYLAAQGFDDIAYKIGLFDLGPTLVNAILGDPGVYVVFALLVEFVFRFTRHSKTLFWRAYQWASCGMVLAAIIVNVLGVLQHVYTTVETLWAIPIVILLPLQLVRWARQGNREAALLVVPVGLIALSGAILEFGYIAVIFLHITALQWLYDPVPIGPFPVRQEAFAYALFLLTIGAVMVLRFQRVSRAQARSAAELEAARLAQRRLVPDTLPSIPACTIDAAYLPAAEVGGDFYQVIPQPSGATLIVVGDVSGKGLKAAMTGTLAIGALRSLASEELSLAQILTRLNAQLAAASDGGFVTCLCARIEENGNLTLADAGHLAPYRNGEEIQLESGLPLGIAPDVTYCESTICLAPNDQLTFLSDGVIEARNPRGELFGFERTAAISGQPAKQIVEAAKQFGQEDDITVLTLTIGPGGGASRLMSMRA